MDLARYLYDTWQLRPCFGNKKPPTLKKSSGAMNPPEMCSPLNTPKVHIQDS